MDKHLPRSWASRVRRYRSMSPLTGAPKLNALVWRASEERRCIDWPTVGNNCEIGNTIGSAVAICNCEIVPDTFFRINSTIGCVVAICNCEK